MLKWHVDVGEDLFVLGQDLHERIGEGFRIEVVRAYPLDAVHVPEGLQQLCEGLALRQVSPIGDGILADQVELDDTR